MNRKTKRKLISVLAALCISAVLLPIASAADSAPADYIAAWDFESLTDGKVTDSNPSEVKYHGVMRKPDLPANCGVKAGAGINESSGLSLSGTTADTQMNAPGLGRRLAAGKAITIAGWFNNTELSNVKNFYMFTVPNKAGNAGFGLCIMNTGDKTNGKKFKLELKNQAVDSGWNNLYSPTEWTATNEWHHFAALADMTAGGATTRMAIYIDGVLIAENTVNVGAVSAFDNLGPTGNYDFRIGSQGSNVFNGALDDIKVFDRALTQAEIGALAVAEVSSSAPLTLTVGGMDVLSLEGVEVSALTEPGATLFPDAFPLTGIAYTLPEDAQPREVQVLVNGERISEEALADCTINKNDVIVYQWLGTQAEGNSYRQYKVTCRAEGLFVKDVGFYQNGVKVEHPTEGAVPKCIVQSTYLQPQTVYLLTVCRQADTGRMQSVSLAAQTLEKEDGETELSGAALPPEAERCELELYVTDAAFRPLDKAVRLQHQAEGGADS